MQRSGRSFCCFHPYSPWTSFHLYLRVTKNTSSSRNWRNASTGNSRTDGPALRKHRQGTSIGYDGTGKPGRCKDDHPFGSYTRGKHGANRDLHEKRPLRRSRKRLDKSSETSRNGGGKLRGTRGTWWEQRRKRVERRTGRESGRKSTTIPQPPATITDGFSRHKNRSKIIKRINQHGAGIKGKLFSVFRQTRYYPAS